MARATIVLSVLISSPSDVAAECATVVTAVHDWNSSYSQELGIILDPVRWQTHAYPESGDRPQSLINRQIVDASDMVVAVFGHRIGTATGVAQSGTIEEIERLRGNGKHVAVYFSNAPIPRDHDPEQLRRLKQYQESLKANTLYWTFDSTEDLYRLVSQHLARSVSRLHQELRASGTIRLLASQLPGVVSGPELRSDFESKGSEEHFKFQHVFIGEFPKGPMLRITANTKFNLLRLDYLDGNGVRVSSDEVPTSAASSLMVEGKGEQLDLPVDHAKLVQIHNLKPRTGSEAFPVQFRLHLLVNGRAEMRTVPALIHPAFKNVDNTMTYFMKLVG